MSLPRLKLRLTQPLVKKSYTTTEYPRTSYTTAEDRKTSYRTTASLTRTCSTVTDMTTHTVTNHSQPHPPTPPPLSDSLTTLLIATLALPTALLIYLTCAESRVKIAGCTRLTLATLILLTQSTGPHPTALLRPPGPTTPGFSPLGLPVPAAVMTTRINTNVAVVDLAQAVTPTGLLAQCQGHLSLALRHLLTQPRTVPTLQIMPSLKVHGADVGIVLLKIILELFVFVLC